MGKEKTAVEKLYDDPKSKGFVNHLIRAYLPINKPKKVWEFPDSKKSYKCNVCGHSLIDLGTVLGRMYTSEDYMKDTIEQMRKELQGEKIEREDRAIIKHITHGAIQAWQGEKTTTFLCADCIKDLLDMVTTGILRDDKNIVWITRSMQREQVFDHFKSSPVVTNPEKEKLNEIHKRADQKKMTFGDLQVLQDLKQRMEKEETK